MTSKWRETPAPEHVRVETKVQNANGVHNVQMLTRRKGLYFCDDGTYVYYYPTHWRQV